MVVIHLIFSSYNLLEVALRRLSSQAFLFLFFEDMENTKEGHPVLKDRSSKASVPGWYVYFPGVLLFEDIENNQTGRACLKTAPRKFWFLRVMSRHNSMIIIV